MVVFDPVLFVDPDVFFPDVSHLTLYDSNGSRSTSNSLENAWEERKHTFPTVYVRQPNTQGRFFIKRVEAHGLETYATVK